MVRCWFHDWGKWERVDKKFRLLVRGRKHPVNDYEAWQQKICKRCGFIKERRLP